LVEGDFNERACDFHVAHQPRELGGVARCQPRGRRIVQRFFQRMRGRGSIMAMDLECGRCFAGGRWRA
jgi:hypothetical protein